MIEQAGDLADADLSQRVLVGPHSVELAFSRSGLLSELIAGAFFHDENRSEAPPTQVFICQEGDGLRLPNLDWAALWIGQNLVIPQHLSAPFRVFVDKYQGIIYCFDPRNNRAAIYLRNAKQLDLRSFVTPFRLLWSWLASSHASVVLHGAVVSVGGHGVLMSGPSGSGKSTLALSVARSSNHAIVADDCVMVRGNRAHAVYARVKAEASQFTALGVGERVGINFLPGWDDAKSFVDIAAAFPRHVKSVEVSTVIYPTIAGRSGYYSMKVKESASLLTRDSLREIFLGTTQDRIQIARFARGLPAFRVLLGESAFDNARIVERVLSDG
jgi:energy-coupling factor transporter ATP-binding protein EcfA2